MISAVRASGVGAPTGIRRAFGERRALAVVVVDRNAVERKLSELRYGFDGRDRADRQTVDARGETTRIAADPESLLSTKYGDSVVILVASLIDGTLVHVSSWYDNEMGYSARCVDLMQYMAQRL